MTCNLDEGWRLSSAFNLVPDIGQRDEHVLFFDLDPVYPGRANLMRMGRAWGVSGVAEIVEQVFSVVSDWREAYLACVLRKKTLSGSWRLTTI